MAFRLGPRALASGYRLAAYETIGSTSTEAMARARAGDPGRLWVVAGMQTAGHGRRGRAWHTESGNLAASLLLVDPAPPASAATLGFAAGLALEHAIWAYARISSPGTGEAESARSAEPGEGSRDPLYVRDPHPLASRVGLSRPGRGGQTFRSRSAESGLRLKWPNDVLVDGGKVAGILLEAVSGTGRADALVIGMGVNVRHAPDGLPYPATSLAACGASVTAEGLFEALSDAWVEQERVWDRGRGFAAIRARWLDRAAGLGAPIAVKLGEDVLRGTFETIDEDGKLVVRAADGSRRTVAAGEVHFGAAATAGQ